MTGSFIDLGDAMIDFGDRSRFRRRTRTDLRDRLKEMFPEMVGDTDLALDIPASKPLRYGYHPADCPKCGKRNYTGGNSLCGGANEWKVWVIHRYHCACGCRYRAVSVSRKTRTVRHDLLRGPYIEHGFEFLERRVEIVDDEKARSAAGPAGDAP